MKVLRIYFDNQISEIENAWSLRAYGFCLGLLHPMVYLLWSNQGNQSLNLLLRHPPMCWPIFESCQIFRPFIFFASDQILAIYLIASLISAILFLRISKIKFAYYGLLTVSALQLFIFFQDYRLIESFQAVEFLAIGFFLFIPEKVLFGRLILVASYIISGFDKLNSDWLSGMAFGQLFSIKGKFLEWVCALVVFLEIGLSPVLFFRKAYIFWPIFILFLIFHLGFYSLVGYEFTGSLILLLSIFALVQISPQPVAPARSLIPGSCLMIIFVFAQIYPAFINRHSSVFGGDRRITLDLVGERMVCENQLILKYTNQTLERKIYTRSGAYLECDPVVYYYRLRELCLAVSKEEGFIDLDFKLIGKKIIDVKWDTKIDRRKVCTSPLKLSWFGKFKDYE